MNVIKKYKQKEVFRKYCQMFSFCAGQDAACDQSQLSCQKPLIHRNLKLQCSHGPQCTRNNKDKKGKKLVCKWGTGVSERAMLEVQSFVCLGGGGLEGTGECKGLFLCRSRCSSNFYQ